MIEDLKKGAENPIGEATQKMRDIFEEAFGDMPERRQVAGLAAFSVNYMMGMLAAEYVSRREAAGAPLEPLALFRIAADLKQILESAVAQELAANIRAGIERRDRR